MEKDNSEAKPSTATPPSDEKKTSGGSGETPAPRNVVYYLLARQVGRHRSDVNLSTWGQKLD